MWKVVVQMSLVVQGMDTSVLDAERNFDRIQQL